MRIVCPSCATVYEVPAPRMTARRQVRCARCGGEWVVVRDATEAPPEHEQTQPQHAAEPAALPPVTAMDRLAAPARRPSSTAGLRVAWVVTCVTLAAAIAGTITWREAIIRAWPPAGRILAPLVQNPPAAGSNQRSGSSQPPKP